MSMVNIYLIIEDRQVHTLSIPLSDIKRFSVRPLKWLLYVTFSICGVQGDLSETPNGCCVNYSTSHADIAPNYYYTPQGDYQFIDYHALDDQITFSARTQRSSSFRRGIMERDGSTCVFTGVDACACDAVHIVPKSKGNAYIATVLKDRLKSYTNPPAKLDISINSVENGIFLSGNLHCFFSSGKTVILKTPNFALNCDDIPRVEKDRMPSSRLTLQHLTPITGRVPILQWDASITGTGPSQPLDVLLDFVYGVAAFSHWGQQGINDIIRHHSNNHYQTIPAADASLQHQGRSCIRKSALYLMSIY